MLRRATSLIFRPILGTLRLGALGGGGALGFGALVAALAGLDRTVTGEQLHRPAPAPSEEVLPEPIPEISESEAAMELGRMGVLGMVAVVVTAARTWVTVVGVTKAVIGAIPILIKGSIAGAAFLAPVVALGILLDRLLLGGKQRKPTRRLQGDEQPLDGGKLR